MSYLLKSIASNTVAQLVAKFFGAGLTLLTTYYTISLAGLPLYGDFTKVIVLVAVGFTLIDFGLNAEAIRHKIPVSTVIITRLFLSCLVLAILNLFINLLGGGYSPEIKRVFWLGSLAIIFQGFFTSANTYFQANLTYWRSTLAVVLGALVGSALTFYYLVTAPTLFNLVFANTIGAFTLGFSALIMLPRCSDIRSSISDIQNLLRASLLLGTILIASVFASKIDTVILGIYRSSAEVGAYGFAYRIFDVVLVLPVFFMNSLYPLLLRPHSPHLFRRTTTFMSLLGIFAGVILYFSTPLLTLFRPELSSSIIILRALALSTPLFYLTAPLMWQLIAHQKDRAVLSTYVSAALLNLALNLFFTPTLGPLSAALITGFTELFILLSLLYFSRASHT